MSFHLSFGLIANRQPSCDFITCWINVQMNQLVSEQHTGLIKLNGVSKFGHLPLFGVQKECVNTILVLWCVGRFSEYQKVLWFTTAGEPQHDPKRNDTWLCAWRFGQVHAGWFMPASSPRSPGANIDCFFFLLSWRQMGGSNFFILGASTNGTCKDANTPDREHFSPTKCLLSEKV